jgi:hypothetical protein
LSSTDSWLLRTKGSKSGSNFPVQLFAGDKLVTARNVDLEQNETSVRKPGSWTSKQVSHK